MYRKLFLEIIQPFLLIILWAPVTRDRIPDIIMQPTDSRKKGYRDLSMNFIKLTYAFHLLFL